MLFTDVSHARAVRVFMKAGFWVVKSMGSRHTGMTDGKMKVVIPRHTRLNPYTLKSIIRDAGLTDSEFKKLL
ncbi:MAG: type II toxin-antitoxin system HicA family toxin [bacterium]|nr:type II toxin-antitoxin system HicA family toxin [bacterium]MDZ4285953.1 type II toxin-antitoxin system HicA family toxin [Candidatus Sungbacteria bacterium]